MTNKTITLKQTKDITEIAKGTILKRVTDLFIVTEVVREHEDPMHDLLLLSHPPKPYYRRVRTEGKYQLTSLDTGGNFFDDTDTLQDLLRLIVNDGKFEKVDSIEFKEV